MRGPPQLLDPLYAHWQGQSTGEHSSRIHVSSMQVQWPVPQSEFVLQ
jgi:hypothetical protein